MKGHCGGFKVISLTRQPVDQPANIGKVRQGPAFGKCGATVGGIEGSEDGAGRTGNAGIEEDCRDGRRQAYRHDPFPFSAHEGGLAKEGDRHVPAELRRDGAGMPRVNVPEAGEQAKGSGGVRRSAANAGCDGQRLFQMQRRAVLDACFGLQRTRGLEDEIVGSGASLFCAGSGDGQREDVGGFDRQPVGSFRAGEDNQRVEVMASIGFGRADMQEEVHLGRRICAE